MGVIGRPSRARLAVTSTALSGARRAPASGALLRAGRRPRARTRRDSIAAKGGHVFGSAYLGPAVSMWTMAMMAWGLPTSGGYAAAMRQR